MKHKRTARLVAALTLVGSIFAIGSPASADAPEEHCALILPATEVAHCWPTFEEARQFAVDHGALGDPTAGLRTTTAGVTSLTLISIEYSGWFKTGSSLWMYGKHGNCSITTSDLDYGVSILPSSWDNRISSFQSYSYCIEKHFSMHTYFGVYVGWSAGESVIGPAIDNDTTSIEWT